MRCESESTRGGQNSGAEDSGGRTRALHLRRAVCCARLRHRLAFRCTGHADTVRGCACVRDTDCARHGNADGGGALVGTAPLHTDRLLRRGHGCSVVEVVDGSAAAGDTHPGLMSRGSRARIHDRRRRRGCERPGAQFASGDERGGGGRRRTRGRSDPNRAHRSPRAAGRRPRLLVPVPSGAWRG